MAAQSINEEIADEIRKHFIYLGRLGEFQNRKIAEILDGLIEDMAGKLAITGVDGRSSLTATQRTKLNKLFSEAKRLADSKYTEINDQFDDFLSELGTTEAYWGSKYINDIARIELMTTTPKAVQRIQAALSDIMIEGAPMKEWWSRQSTGMINHFKDQIRIGYLNGETNSQIVGRILEGVDGNGNKIYDLAKGSKRGTEAIVRSGLLAVSNKALDEVYQDNRSVVKGYTWVATLDDRTTLMCASLDGLSWTLDGEPIGNHDKVFELPPIHWNCRSVVSPLLKTYRDLGIDIGEIPDSTRASMDGQVPSKIGFDNWLKKKESEQKGFVINMFGVGKADLWKKGLISVKEMTNRYAEPLTLAELRKKIGL